MHQRRSGNGRPSGTDGSDFSYRMVVDSRYQKVAQYKSRLSVLIFTQVIKDFSSWGSSIFELAKVAAGLLGLVVQIYTISTTASLIQNMAPPKRTA